MKDIFDALEKGPKGVHDSVVGQGVDRSSGRHASAAYEGLV